MITVDKPRSAIRVYVDVNNITYLPYDDKMSVTTILTGILNNYVKYFDSGRTISILNKYIVVLVPEFEILAFRDKSSKKGIYLKLINCPNFPWLLNGNQGSMRKIKGTD